MTIDAETSFHPVYSCYHDREPSAFLFAALCFWHFWHGMPNTVYETVRPSVSLSVCPVSLLQQPVAGLLLWAWRQAISIDCCTARLQQAIHIHSSTALSSKCQQCHVFSDVGSWTPTCLFLGPSVNLLLTFVLVDWAGARKTSSAYSCYHDREPSAFLFACMYRVSCRERRPSLEYTESMVTMGSPLCGYNTT